MRLLGEQPEAEPGLALDLSQVGLVDAGRDSEHRRLSGAIRADQADSVANGHGDLDLVEDDEGADLARDPFEAQDRHGSGPARGREPGPGRGASGGRSTTGSLGL